MEGWWWSEHQAPLPLPGVQLCLTLAPGMNRKHCWESLGLSSFRARRTRAESPGLSLAQAGPIFFLGNPWLAPLAGPAPLNPLLVPKASLPNSRG